MEPGGTERGGTLHHAPYLVALSVGRRVLESVALVGLFRGWWFVFRGSLTARSPCPCTTCSPVETRSAAAIPEEKEGSAKKQASKAPALPPRKKHVAAARSQEVEKKTETEVEEKNEVEEKTGDVSESSARKSEELKHVTEVALASAAAAAAVHDVAGTIANVEKVSDVVDDQMKMAKEEAIEAVVEIVAAEVAAEEAIEEAEAVLAEAQAHAGKDETAAATEKKAFLVTAPPKKRNKKKNEISGQGEGDASQEAAQAQPMPIENVFTVGDLRGKTLSGKATTEDRSQPLLEEEAEDAVESLEQVAHPELSFANAKDDSSEEVEGEERRIRDMIVEAHHLGNQAVQTMHADPALAQNLMRRAVQTAQDAMDACVARSSANGDIRPSLVAATAFALAEIKIHAHGGRPNLNELKVCYAVALEAVENASEATRKGGKSKAYIAFGNLMQNQQKPKSALSSYMMAYDAAKADYGDVHQLVEQAKYDYTAYLAKCGRSRECVDFLVAGAKELQERADELEKAYDGDKAKDKDKDADGGAEGEAADASGEDQQIKSLPVHKLARHFAMKNLMNAAGVLDTRGEHIESQELLADTLELAISVHGENSVQHMNTLYAIGNHCKARQAIDEAIACHEAVLNIIDATIQVYDPDLLQNRVAILKDTAQLYDLQGHPEMAIDYAEGACINAQTLARIYAQSETFPLPSRIGMLEPFWQLLVDLKTKVGDTEGAAAARREINRGKASLTGASQGARGGARRRAPPPARGRARR